VGRERERERERERGETEKESMIYNKSEGERKWRAGEWHGVARGVMR
jgi:hypothetical protein